METKNIILSNYAATINTMTNSFAMSVDMLGDNKEENYATIKTLNVLLESLRSQITIIQQAIDSY